MAATKTKRRTKTADSKGRITLGAKFADRTVLLTPVSETEVLVTLAQVIPEREAWLYKNTKAFDSVRRGLEQARAREYSKRPPNLAADARFADSLPDDE